MLEHGGPEASAFLDHLERARVVSRCACGCATIDLQVDGLQPARDAGMRVLADFWFEDGDETSGVFIYAYGGVLSGIEVTGYSGDHPKVLPMPESLHPLVAVEDPGRK